MCAKILPLTRSASGFCYDELVNRAKALLFDCDGTLADTMPLHYSAYRHALSEYGCVLDWDTYLANSGGGGLAALTRISQLHGWSIPVPDVVSRKSEVYRSLLTTGCVRGNRRLISLIAGHRATKKMAVVTDGCRSETEIILARLGILEQMDCLVYRESLRALKPDPEGYLLASRLLGVQPTDCLVFEDTLIGVEAASNARMNVVEISDFADHSHVCHKGTDC